MAARASTLVALELDDVLIAVADVTTAARELEGQFGLASIDGGRHPGWGTANRIVPLGVCYLELVAVADEAEAAQSPFGHWVARAHPTLAKPLGWAVRTTNLDAVAKRLGLDIAAGSRVSRGGRLLRWRLAGIEQAAAEPSLPFFIEWADGTSLPGLAPVTHPAGSVQVAELQLRGDRNRLAAWLGAADHLPIIVRSGAPALTSIILGGTGGEIVLDADRLQRRQADRRSARAR
jgi:glyoxalase-like protein